MGWMGWESNKQLWRRYLTDSHVQHKNTHPHLQNNLDPEKFLRAPRSVIEHTLAYIEEKFGSIEAYLDTIGFDAEKRARLIAALTAE